MWMVLTAFGQPTHGRYTVWDPGVLAGVQEAAIDEALLDFPWAARPFARPLVRKQVWNCGTLGLHIEDRAIVVDCDDHERAVFSASALEWTDEKGETFALEVTIEDAYAAVVLSSNRGSMRWDYLFGDVLTVRTTLTSGLLGHPMVWDAAYRSF